MTVVGKILVFLNLVFSLVVGGFAVVDYTARTHWADAVKKFQAQNQVLQSAAATYKGEADRLAREKEGLYERLAAQRVNWDPGAKDDIGGQVADRALTVLTERARTIGLLSARVDELTKQLAAARADNEKLKIQERVYTTDASRRQQDSQILRDHLKAEIAKNHDLQKEMNRVRDDMVSADIQSRTLKERNTQLERQLQELARSLAQAKSNLGATGLAGRNVNPPPEDVEGLVQRAEDRLVTISLGSDAGLAKGQTMEVFRLGQNPRYIGRIRLVEVTAKQAVGQVASKLTTPIQVGDRVASRIMGSR